MSFAVCRWPLAVGLALVAAPALSAQSLPTTDSVLKRIWEEGMDRSQVYETLTPLSSETRQKTPGRGTGKPPCEKEMDAKAEE